MILCVDIGNTTVGLALMRRGEVLDCEKFLTASVASGKSGPVRVLIRRWQKKYGRISGGIICSVVPKATQIIERTLKAALTITPYVVGRDIKVPIRNLYRRPGQVGQDRLVAAYAAAVFYGTPAVVVDLGTAITLDVVSPRGDYLGGIIVPGIRLSAESLWQKTALLPLVDIKRPRRLVGKDTETSILSGLFYGYGEMLKGLIRKLCKDFSRPPKVIMTGGYARLMRFYLKGIVHQVDDHLVFKGIARLWHTVSPQ